MTRFVITGLIVLAAAVLAPNQLLAQDHKEMHGDHATALKEHSQWAAEIGKMKVEHRLALAALAKLRAEILEHEAEIEAMSVKIQQHNMQITQHDHAIHDHEKTGDDSSHDELEKKHVDVMKMHQSLAKSMQHASDDHSDLIQGILKFAKKHMKKFHHEQSGEHGSHEKSTDHKHE